MTEEALMKAAQFGVWDSLVNGMSVVKTFEWFFIGILCAVFLMLIYLGASDREWPAVWKLCGFLFLCLIAFVGSIYETGRTSTHPFEEDNTYHGAKYEEFANDYMHPYIESMKEKKVPIQAVKRLEHEAGNVHGPTPDRPLIPVSIIYADKNNDAQILEADALIRYEPKDVEPYMTYKEFTQDIAFDFKKGPFNVTLHLPKGYYFNQ